MTAGNNRNEQQNFAAKILLRKETGIVLVLCVLLALLITLVSQAVNGIKEDAARKEAEKAAAAAATPASVVQSEEVPAEPAEPQIKLGYISGNNVMFRAEASTDGPVKGEFYYGNEVQVLERGEEWTEIVFDGETGYVHGEFVKARSEMPQVNGREIAELAKSLTGTMYVWGGDSPEIGFDCSGLISYVYGQYGIPVNRIAGDMLLNGVAVSEEEAQPGDIVLFKNGDTIDHAGIYIGDGCIVHAANSAAGVRISSLVNFENEGERFFRRIL